MKPGLFVTTILLLGAPSTWAQTSKATPPPAASPAPKAQRTITATPSRPGSYTCWAITANGTVALTTLTTSQTSATFSLPEQATEVRVLDDTSGMVARYPVAQLKNDKLAIAPADFNALHKVLVRVTGEGGKLAEKATVTLTDAQGKTTQRMLTGTDKGEAIFEDVPLGKATITAHYSTDGPKASQETTIAAAKSGAFEATLTVAGVPTLAASPAPAAPNGSIPAPTTPIVIEREKAEPSNGSSLIAGWVGLLVLIGGGLYLLRYLRARGLTVTGAFRQLGVDLPKDAPANSGLAPAKPAPAPLPPLPSLADLPAAGAAPGGVAVAGAVAPSAPPLPAPTGQPRLVGLSGPAVGKVIPLVDTLSVGREPDNALAFPADTTVSRKHALFLPSAGGWELTDSGSSNGTFVNGNRLTAPQSLAHGDEIKIGASRLRFEA